MKVQFLFRLLYEYIFMVLDGENMKKFRHILKFILQLEISAAKECSKELMVSIINNGVNMQKIFIVFIFFNLPLYSQSNYFPLNVGNYWQFNGDNYMEILGDTIMGNQQQLVKRVKMSFTIAPYLDSLEYFQYDSSSNSIKEYAAWVDSGAILFNFSASPYESWHSLITDIRYYGSDTLSVFNTVKLVKVFWGGGIPSFAFYLAEDIGPIKIVNDQSWVIPSVYNYNLNYAKINGIEYGQVVSASVVNPQLPTKFFLSQNYPNPFNPITTIEFQIASASGGGFVSLKVYDILGREVATLVNEEKHAGNYEVTFDGSGLSSGIYFYKFNTENYTSVKKMILMK